MLTNHARPTLNPLLITLMLLVFLAVFIKWQQATIRPLPASAPESVFSAQRAVEMLQQLTKEQVPHPVDSAANRVVEERLTGLLRDMGYRHTIQDTPICQASKRGFARCTRVRNIIVEIKGRQPGKGILLSAHYDSVAAGPGGSDAGAAVGTLLEVARLLKQSPQPLNTIVLLFNEGEEFGLFGARAFMQQHPLAKNLQLAINIEARGSAGQSIMFETAEDSGWLVEHYAQTTPLPASSSLFYEVYKFLPNDTDMTIFKQHGLQGLNFAHAERLPHYHTPLDNLANLDRGSLQHHGDNVWGILKRIKDSDLSRTKPGNLIYTDMLGLFVIHWDEATSIWLSLALLAGLALALLRFGKQQQGIIKALLFGILALLLILAGSALSAWLIQTLSQTLSGHPSPWHSNDLPMQVALWSAVLLSGLLIARRFGQKASPVTLTLALTLVWVLCALAGSIWLPGISFLFILPGAVAVVGLLLLSWINTATLSTAAKSALAVAILIAIALTAAIIFMPLAYALATMLGYRLSLAIGVVLGFVTMALLPLTALSTPASPGTKKGFNILAYGLTLLTLVAVGKTGWQTIYSPWMPQALNLTYFQHHHGEAFILVGHRRNRPPSSLVDALPADSQLQAVFPWSKWLFHTAPARSQQYRPTRATLLASHSDGGGKTVTLNLSAGGATSQTLSDIRVYIPKSAALKSIKSGNDTLGYQQKDTVTDGYDQYRCRGLSCRELELTLNFGKDKPVTILIATVYAGLPRVYQSLTDKRGPNAVPQHSGDQSIIVTELTL